MRVTVAVFPVALAAGIALIPLVADYADHDAAARAAAQETRWAVGHLLAAAAFGLGAFAVTEVAAWLGAFPARAIVVPLMCVGAALHAAGLGADGVGPLAGDARVFFDRSGAIVPIVFMTGAALWSPGLIYLALVVKDKAGFPRGQAAAIVVASIVFAVAEAIPFGWGLYIVAAAGLAMFLPLARRMGAQS